MNQSVELEVPPKLIPVFAGSARFRGAWGGRGSGKTRTFAKMAAVRALIYAQAGTSGIILCGREYMNYLDESSMAEVKHAILSEPWLAEHFDIGERYIRTRCKRVEFKFTGLRYNLDSIKSKARILILWVDEAEPVSRAAWDKIMPTVREADSEIWVTWNPETDGSPTDEMFKKNPPPDSKIVEMNWSDNPWFPDVLRQQMEWDRKRDPEKFGHIWQGDYLSRSESRVFNNWIVDEFKTPDDIERFYYGADWGYSIDPSVLVRCFITDRTLYIDHEAYAVGCEIEHTPALFAGACPHSEDSAMKWDNPKQYTGIEGALRWPIVADSARPETISYMKRKGFNIRPAKKGPGSVMDGIEFLKNYDIVAHPRCRHTIDELTHYRWKVDSQTDEVLPVLEDKKNHVIDSLRYAVEGIRRGKPSKLGMIGERQVNWAEVMNG